jgi:hypothetical protein
MQRSAGAGVLVAAGAAIALASFGIVQGTWAVGGSDSSCYALTALAMSEGDLQPSSPLAVEAPWPDASRTLAPGGFIPSPVRADAASPICAPGLPVLMAPLAAIFGRDAIFLLVPLSGAVLVFGAFAIARQLAGAMAGAVAAVLTAASPIVLYQVVQPMNDVVTAALWIAVFALLIDQPSAVAHSAPADKKGVSPHLAAGLLIGAAVVVRPNLAPVAMVAASIPLALSHERPWRAIALMIAAASPGAIVMFYLNHALYGSILGSGYGDAAQLFSVAHVGANVANLGRALFQTQNIVPAIALAAPFFFTGHARRLSLILLVAAAAVIALYLSYQPYPEWWYLRFLMPAIVMLVILASGVAVQAATRARMGGVVPIAAVVLVLLGVRTAGERQAFELQRLEGRYRDTAQIVADRLPSNAVLITVWQSGSVRFHASREAVLWDSMDPAWLDRAVAWLTARGLQPYLLFERREESAFRARFRGHSQLGALDWPPRIDINRQARIYDPADRAGFLAGETYQTDNIRPR